jgi:predicted dinucleotide-utilizing enzyme
MEKMRTERKNGDNKKAMRASEIEWTTTKPWQAQREEHRRVVLFSGSCQETFLKREPSSLEAKKGGNLKL